MPYRSVSLGKYLPATALEYYVRWLAEERRTHRPSAVRDFVRAHPFMFGTSAEVTVRGYERRLVRTPDDPETFAAYIATRYERWRAARAAARSGKRPPRAS